jgi:hypothetical protein
MFEIIDNSTFNEMFNGINKPMDIFINHFKNKKSTTFLYWYVLEFVAPPFNYYNHEEKHEDIIKLENILIDNDLKIYVIISGVSTKLTDELKTNPIKNVTFLLWPTYLLHYSCYGLEKVYGKPIKDVKIETKFKNLYCNYNVKSKYHRGMLMDKLFQTNLFDYGKNSWRINDQSSYNFKFWVEENIKIDDYGGDEFTGYYTDKFLNLNSFINVVGETLYNNQDIFITEKTFKCILIEQPFICLSSQYFHKHLSDLGFKLYEEIFDYGFDCELELEDRVDGIINNLLKIKNKDYNVLYEKIKEKVVYNKYHAIKIIENDEFIPNLFLDLYNQNKNSFDFSENILPYYFKKIIKNKN